MFFRNSSGCWREKDVQDVALALMSQSLELSTSPQPGGQRDQLYRIGLGGPSAPAVGFTQQLPCLPCDCLSPEPTTQTLWWLRIGTGRCQFSTPFWLFGCLMHLLQWMFPSKHWPLHLTFCTHSHGTNHLLFPHTSLFQSSKLVPSRPVCFHFIAPQLQIAHLCYSL